MKLFLLLPLLLLFPQPSFAATNTPGWQQLHSQALNHPRRIIFNNDGNEPVYFCKKPTAEALLEPRTLALAGTQVDSIFYCTWSSGFGVFTHNTKVGQVFTNREAMFTNNLTGEFLARGIDPLRVMVDFAHSNRMELFWSMRMNDTHDASRAAYGPVMFAANPLKRAHPEWLIADKAHPPKYGTWSAVNYSIPEIRDLAFRYCEEVCRNYDVDGLELDFFRHAFFFKSSATGAACTPAELEQMTSLIRRIRAMTEDLGRQRGRPILLAIRVPDSVPYARYIGLDWEKWLKDGLIDILIAGGYTQFNPWEDTIKLGHQYGVKVYPSLDEPRLRDQPGLQLRQSDSVYRGRALEALAAGVDGIYIFNFFYWNRPLWKELGDPAILRRLARTYVASPMGFGSMPVPHRGYLNVPTINPSDQIHIPPGKSVRLDLFTAEEGSYLTNGIGPILRLRFENPYYSPDTKVSLNGNVLANGWRDPSRAISDIPPEGWAWGAHFLEFNLAGHPLRPFRNEIEITCPADEPSPLRLQDIWVTCRPD